MMIKNFNNKIYRAVQYAPLYRNSYKLFNDFTLWRFATQTGDTSIELKACSIGLTLR